MTHFYLCKIQNIEDNKTKHILTLTYLKLQQLLEFNPLSVLSPFPPEIIIVSFFYSINSLALNLSFSLSMCSKEYYLSPYGGQIISHLKYPRFFVLILNVHYLRNKIIAFFVPVEALYLWIRIAKFSFSFWAFEKFFWAGTLGRIQKAKYIKNKKAKK